LPFGNETINFGDEGVNGQDHDRHRSYIWRAGKSIIIIIVIFFITHASSVMILNQRRWQSLDRKHGKGVDGLFEKVSLKVSKVGESLTLKRHTHAAAEAAYDDRARS